MGDDSMVGDWMDHLHLSQLHPSVQVGNGVRMAGRMLLMQCFMMAEINTGML